MKKVITTTILSISCFLVHQGLHSNQALANTLLSTDGTLSNSDSSADEIGFYDSYTIQAQAGQQITATLESSAFDTFIIVSDPSTGNKIAENDDMESGITNSSVTFTPTRTGNYTIYALAYRGGETGRYRLSVFASGNPNTPGGNGSNVITINPVSSAGNWYVYQKPSSISDDQMELAGAGFYPSHVACSMHYSLCTNLSGVWLSQQSSLSIQQFQSQSQSQGQFQAQSSEQPQTATRSLLEQCIDSQVNMTLNGSRSNGGGFLFDKPEGVSSDQMRTAGLSRSLFGKWWSPSESSVNIQLMDFPTAATYCRDALES